MMSSGIFWRNTPQHIDIKMQNGQSEEDAIRDFGPVKELAAEILEAYHVKPDLGRKSAGRGFPSLAVRRWKRAGWDFKALGAS